MTHLQFVIVSYAAAAIGLGGILIWLLADRHRQLSALRQLEKAMGKHQKADSSPPWDMIP